MKSRLFHGALLLGLAVASTATAQDVGEVRAKRPRLGMQPGAPQNRSVAPTIPFGVEPTRADDWVLDFHGFVLAPLTLGVSSREQPASNQSKLLLNSPPQIPQDLRTFNYTGVIPSQWVQLNFTYGTTLVRGTAIIAARQVASSTPWINPPDQLGVSDAFVSFDLTEPLGQVVQVNVGAFKNRYGPMGEYDAGRYGTPLIARTNYVGETIAVALDFQDYAFLFEEGFGGSLSVPTGITPAGWNDFADPRVGATLVAHGHAGFSLMDTVQVGLHFIRAFSSDDRALANLPPEGSITVVGADARMTAGPYGHLYLGVAKTTAKDAVSVGGAIEILNARGGQELMDNYLGPNSGGNGSLLTYGGQYDLSLARLLYPNLEGHGPDILFSLFGMGTNVTSNDHAEDGARKLKFGAEATYSMLSWLAVGGRVDNVMPDADAPDLGTSFQIFSPRVIFHSDWNSTDQLVLQYSRFFYGDGVVVKGGYPPVDDPTIVPDRDVISLAGSVWW
jgi:hypothetical protein